MPLVARSRKISYGLPAAASFLLAGCGWFGENDKLPYYQLTPEQRAWAAIYQQETTWRFRSEATGYERTYRIHNTVDKKQPNTKGKFSVEVAYYRQEMYAQIDRTDSAIVRPVYTSHPQDFLLQAQVESPTTYWDNIFFRLNWEGTSLALPMRELTTGHLALSPPYQLLPQATFNGHTYQNVVVYSVTQYPNTIKYPNTAEHICYTKDLGVVRYVEYSGEAWNRL